MKCKNLIIITGMSCQGKTHIALELKERCGFHTIHTDMYYFPENGNAPSDVVGQRSKGKLEFIKDQKPLLTETTVIEGMHIGNRGELDIFEEVLDFDGRITCFKVVYEDKEQLQRRYKGKYGEGKHWFLKDRAEWFKKIYNLRECYVVSSVEEILNLLEKVLKE